MRSFVYIAFKIIAITIVSFVIIIALSSILPAIGDFIEKIKQIFFSIAGRIRNLDGIINI